MPDPSRSQPAVGPTYKRTHQGSEELVLRQHGLSEDQRRLLLYANGNRGIHELERLVPEARDNPEVLVLLEELGFLAPYDPEIGTDAPNPCREHEPKAADSAAPAQANGSDSALPESVKRVVIDDLRTMLGTDSAEAVDRIARISSVEDFRAALRKLDGLIRVYAGDRKTELFVRKIEEMLLTR